MTLVEPGLAEQVLRQALERGGDFAELYAESRHGFGLSLDDGRVERPQGGRERGACVRVVQGESTYYGHVDGVAEPDLMRVAGSVAQAVRGHARRPAGLSAVTPANGHPVSLAPERVEAARKADLLRACEEQARSAGAEVTQVRLGYAESRREVEIFNSQGRAVSDDRTRVRLSAQVVARRDERVETGTDTRGGHAGFELLEQDPEEVAGLAARRALTLLDAVDAPTGRLPVVVGNGFGGVLLHEAVGHGLEADAVQKGASVYAGRIAEELCPAFVTAYDDGSRAGEWGSDGVDDEGTPTQRTTIIEDGRLTSYLYDLLTARKDGAEPTGNGRRESFRHLPVPRMTNTFFAPGSTPSPSAAARWSRPRATSSSGYRRAT
jgi:TldD protein